MLTLHRVSRALVAGAPGCEARVRALVDVSLRVGPREFVAVTGASACERTLLLLCAAGLARTDAGTVIARAERRYVRASDLDAVFGEQILLVDGADSDGEFAAIARARARGATILAAGASAQAFARAGARVAVLRDGSLGEAHPSAGAPRARVAERALR